MTLKEQVELVKSALADKKAVDVKTYDVRGVSGLADAFVVATGTAAPHLKGIVAGVQRAMKEKGVDSYRTSGDPQSGADPECGSYHLRTRRRLHGRPLGLQ